MTTDDHTTSDKPDHIEYLLVGGSRSGDTITAPPDIHTWTNLLTAEIYIVRSILISEPDPISGTLRAAWRRPVLAHETIQDADTFMHGLQATLLLHHARGGERIPPDQIRGVITPNGNGKPPTRKAP